VPWLGVDGVEVGGQRVERRRVVEVELLVGDPFRERLPGLLVEREDPAVLLERFVDLGPERLVLVRPPADGQEDELVRQQVVAPQLVERRDDLAVGEVAGRPEEHEDRGVWDPLQTQAIAQDVLDRFGT